MIILRTIASILLGILVLLATTSFMVGMHFCGTQIENIALFSKASGCAMEKSLPPCEQHANESCCKDQTIIHEGQDFKISIAQVYFSPIVYLLAAQVPVFISENIPSTPLPIEYYNYDPPLRSLDLTVSLQVFLI